MEYLALSIFGSVAVYCGMQIYIHTRKSMLDSIIKALPLIKETVDSMTALKNAGKEQSAKETTNEKPDLK